MNIIIVGCGRVGTTLAEKLNDDGNAVTVIDSSQEKVKTITGRCDIMGVVGNGATHTVQREAGVDAADLLIAVTNSDELNLLCCMIAKKEGNCRTIARVKNPEYSTEAEYFKNELGLAMVINPEYAAAEEIARVLRFPSALKIEPFVKGSVELIKFRLPVGSKLSGMAVKDVVMKLHCDVLVCTIERGEQTFIPNGDFVFEDKDVISIVASFKNAKEFFENINYKGASIKNALIAGGDVIAHYLCGILERSSVSLKIIEKDLKNCEELSTKYPKTVVIHGNPNDQELLREEGVACTDAFVALSTQDEENILLSMFAKSEGCRKTVMKIKRTDYDGVINRLDLDTTICPKNITSDIILRYVRARKNAKDSHMKTMYNIVQDKVEASEFIVGENSPIVGKPLYQLKFKPDVLIASISRGDTVIVPRGGDVIQAGDAVVVVSGRLGLRDIADVLR